MSEQNFKVKYEVGRFTEEGIRKENKGGTDGFVFFSVMPTKDGGVDIASFSIDGRTGKNMDDFDQFKVWLYFTKRLAESQSKRLPDWAKSCCGLGLEAFKAVTKKAVADPLTAISKAVERKDKGLN